MTLSVHLQWNPPNLAFYTLLCIYVLRWEGREGWDMACYFSVFVFLIFTNPQSTDDLIPKPSLLKMTSSEKKPYGLERL